MQAESLLDEDTTSRLEKNIELLAENTSIPIEELPEYPALDKAYTLLKSVASILYENGEYSSLIPLLTKYKPKNLRITPGTVGSFLFGCLEPSDISPQCTPNCIGSLPQSNAISPCKDQVWFVDSSGRLQQLSPGSSSTAIVYAGSITPSQLKELSSAGVTSYSLVTDNRMGEIRKIDNSAVESADPVNMGQTTSTPVATGQPTEVVAIPTNNNTGLLIAIIIIIIIIILVIWWMNRKKSTQLFA